MPPLERYILHRLWELDGKVRAAYERYEFQDVWRPIADFASGDLSALYFDIRKDVLYCEVNAETGAQTAKRRAYRTVLDLLFHALVRYAAPILAFTAEEVWQARYPSDDSSVHFLEWPQLPALPGDDAISTEWADIRALREKVTEAIEPYRREKTIRSSLEANVTVPEMLRPAAELAEVFIVADVKLAEGEVAVTRTDHAKCGRCWRLLPEVEADGALCHRCDDVVS
jgi:isoleucyl-tRNA synthetase